MLTLALPGSRCRALSHAQGFPSNACDTALVVRRRQPAATPTSRGSTWRSETIEKVSLAFVLFLFPDVGERKTAREKQRRLRRAAPRATPGPDFESFNQTFSLKFWHLVVLTSSSDHLQLFSSLFVLFQIRRPLLRSNIYKCLVSFSQTVSNQCRCESAFS